MSQSFLLDFELGKGLMVGQKSFDLGPPLHLSKKYRCIDCFLIFVT